MAVKITDEIMSSDRTKHTATRFESAWVVTWLPGRNLDRNQAVTAMTLADMLGTIGDLRHSSPMWALIDSWAAELGLSGPNAVVRVSEPELPPQGERPLRPVTVPASDGCTNRSSAVVQTGMNAQAGARIRAVRTGLGAANASNADTEPVTAVRTGHTDALRQAV